MGNMRHVSIASKVGGWLGSIFILLAMPLAYSKIVQVASLTTSPLPIVQSSDLDMDLFVYDIGSLRSR